MITWKQIKKFNGNMSVDYKFHRDPYIQYLYDKRKESGENKNFLDTLFDKEQIYRLTYAGYPYMLEPNLLHIILWLNPLYFQSRSHLYEDCTFIQYIIALMLRISNQNDRLVFFKNSMKNRSVKNIHHYHIIINLDVN